MTIVEAMRCGLPVVATNCPHGPGEIIADGVDGKLVPVGDPQALAGSLLTLINDDDARIRMGGAALASSARFDPATVAGRYEDLFGELLARRREAGCSAACIAPGEPCSAARTPPRMRPAPR